MLDLREWVVEMMEQRTPLLIFRGLPEPDSVILQLLPSDKQKVAVVPFDTTLQFVTGVTRHAGNDRGGFKEGRFKLCLKSRLHIKDSNFKNHAESLANARPLRQHGFIEAAVLAEELLHPQVVDVSAVAQFQKCLVAAAQNEAVLFI